MNSARPESRFPTTPPLFRLLAAASLVLILLFTASIQAARSAGSQQEYDFAYRLEVTAPGLDTKGYLCIGDRIPILVNAFWVDLDSLEAFPYAGLRVSGLVTGGTGRLDREYAYVAQEGPGGRAAYFSFTATKVGHEKLFFETTGYDEYGELSTGLYVERSLEFEVRDCLYEVFVVSRWSGLGRTHVAIIDADLTAVSPRTYEGSVKVMWIVTGDSPPPGCPPPPTATFTSSAHLIGALDDSGDSLLVGILYEKAEGLYDYSDCGYEELLSFTPANLEGDVPAYSGGVFSSSQVLVDAFYSPNDLPGSADVIVLPKSEAGSLPYQDLGPSLAGLASLLAVALVLPIQKNRRFATWKWPFVLLLILVIAAGCGQPTPVVSQSTADSQSTEVAFDPELFEFSDSSVGLAELPGYRSSLSLAFDGTRGGEPEQWTRTYEMLANQTPATRQLAMESSGAVAEPADLWMAEQDGILYELNPQGDCQASVAPEGGLLASQWEPASFLPRPIGAEEAGSETVNGLLASHYTFDERAIRENGRTESAGEVWIAAQGYVVRYLLTTQASSGYFGEDVEGTLTYEYDLTDIGQPALADLPEDCSPGLLHAPLMHDAEDVTQFPTVTRYHTPSTIAEVIAFYQEQFRGLGWLPSGDPVITEAIGGLEFTRDNQGISVIASPSEAGTIVWLLLSDG